MKKAGVVALVGAVLVLGAANVFIAGKLDKESPEINFPEGEVVYEEGSGYESLLAGVTAVDKKDGDVSESLIIESVRPDKEKESASVVYVAMDHKKNVSKEVRKVVYQSEMSEVPAAPDQGESVEMEQKLEVSIEPEISVEPTVPAESEPKPEATEKSEPEEEKRTEKPEENPERSENDSEESENKESGEAETENKPEEELEEGSPRITLSDETITVKKGEEVSRLSYVEDITDDKDDSKELWRKIQIKGDELDTDKEGVYELKYYVIDSDGKKSNEAILKITVQ